MGLLALPSELLLIIANHIVSQRDINSFVCTSRRIWAVINFYLYQFNIVNYQGRVQYFVDAGIGKIIHWDRVPLFYASELGHESVLRTLLEAGAAPDFELQRYDEVISPLSNACSGGHENVVNLLLQYGADANLNIRPLAQRPLHAAAYFGYESIIKLLIQHGADIEANAQDSTGDGRPLHFAVISGELDAFRLLIGNGATVDSSFLHWTITEGHAWEFVIAILETGIDANCRDDELRTPLHSAAMSNNAFIAKVLIEQGAEIEARDLLFSTPLHISVSGGNPEVVSILLELGGADVHARDSKGNTPLHLVTVDRFVIGELSDSLTMLAAKGSSIESENRHRETPLFLAVRNKEEMIVISLIEMGANIEHRNKRGETPIYCALRTHSVSIIRLLHANGCRTDIQNTRGETLLDISAKQNMRTNRFFRALMDAQH